MLLSELILQEFNFLVSEEHFYMDIINITYVYKEIIYSKKNMKIKISVEETENYFTLEIEYVTLKHKYCISDNLQLCKECNLYSRVRDVVYKNIFELTDNQITEHSFKNKLNDLYKKSKKLFNTKKALHEITELYKELIKYTLKNTNKLDNAE